jgi:diguanylate cyclase (GGDEF)-like protein/putative nucleotidyltransferase with HDIG domain
MSYRAWAYVASVLAVGVVLSLLAFPIPALSPFEWLTFAALTLLATFAQLFKVEAPNRQSYYATLVFIFAGVLLLPQPLFIFLVVISFSIEWAKERLIDSPLLRSWYIQPFNIATHIIAGMVALRLYMILNDLVLTALPSMTVIAAALAVLSYVVCNHVLVGMALVLARGVSLRESGVLDVENLLTDLVLLCLGYTVAVLWLINPWLILPALAPLVLMYRALMIPQLKQEARTDAKTGLLNAHYFIKEFDAELERAKRFSRPLTVIMADLDLLRNINNTYGHLAGDTVLAGIGQIIRKTIREYDIAGRFGGEEFGLVLPETGSREGCEIAERIRQAIATQSYEVTTSLLPIYATISMGVACFPDDATTQKELIHQADVAVYQAKIRGRNRVVCAADVPHSIRLEQGLVEKEQATEYPAAFAMNRPVAVHRAGSESPIQSRAYAAQSAVDAPRSEAPAPVPADPSATFVLEGRSAGSGLGKSDRSQKKLWLLVTGVIIAGMAAMVLGFVWHPQFDLVSLGLLIALAMIAELFEVNVYGDNTVSVSAAIGFAAALIAGIPGVVFVSAAITLVHYYRRRPAFYKTAFNWATHILAGAAPVLVMGVLSIPLQISNVPLLAVPMLMAALAYYLVETGLVAAAMSLTTGTHLRIKWREQFGWLASHYLVLCIMGLFASIAYTLVGPLGVLVFVLPVIMMHFTQRQYVERTADGMRELRRLNQELIRANQEISSANWAIRQLNDELFVTIASIIDARDPYVSGHAAQVSRYATAIALELGLSQERLEHVRQAGFLHDIGKIGISEQILHKPDKLTDEEYDYMKTHARRGAELLEASRVLRHLAPFVRHHHERWDGQGYPDELIGEQIPLEARILAVCDAVEAMASDRPYHRALSSSEVIAEVRRCAGTHFDPRIVEAFVGVAEREGEGFIANSASEVQRRQAEHTSHVVNSALPAIGQLSQAV